MTDPVLGCSGASVRGCGARVLGCSGASGAGATGAQVRRVHRCVGCPSATPAPRCSGCAPVSPSTRAPVHRTRAPKHLSTRAPASSNLRQRHAPLRLILALLVLVGTPARLVALEEQHLRDP